MRPARVRAAAFTASGLLLSTTAHVAGEGHAPTLVPLAAVGLLSLLTVGILGTRRRGPVAASTAMVVLQVGAHIAMSGGHAGMAMGISVPPWPMLLAHVLSAVALACALTGADRRLTDRVLAAAAPLQVVGPQVPRLVVRTGLRIAKPSTTRHLPPGRGPPALPA